MSAFSLIRSSPALDVYQAGIRTTPHIRISGGENRKAALAAKPSVTLSVAKWGGANGAVDSRRPPSAELARGRADS